MSKGSLSDCGGLTGLSAAATSSPLFHLPSVDLDALRVVEIGTGFAKLHVSRFCHHVTGYSATNGVGCAVSDGVPW